MSLPYVEVAAPADGRKSMRWFADWLHEDQSDFLRAFHVVLDRRSNGPDYEMQCVKRYIAMRWHEAGRQSVVMPHRYAAALMATDFAEPRLPDLPWPAMEVVVPSGLIRVAGGGQAQAVYLSSSVVANGVGIHALLVFEHICIVARVLAEGFASECAIDSDRSSFTIPVDLGETRRAAKLLIRLAANVVLHIVTTPSQQHRSASPVKCKSDSHGRPVSTTLAIGKPMNLDCRRELHEFVSGRRRSEPKVTTLVRGHWRKQACGPRSSERKLIWIQPFYRGHGPQLVRPTLVGFGESATQVAT